MASKYDSKNVVETDNEFAQRMAAEDKARLKAANARMDFEAMKYSPIFKDILPQGEPVPKNLVSISELSKSIEKDDKKQEKTISASDRAKATLTDAVAKFRADIKKPDATALSLVKPLLESFSSIKAGEKEIIEIGGSEAANIVANYKFTDSEKARLEQLGLPKITSDLEYMRDFIGINSIYNAQQKPDLDYVKEFNAKYEPQLNKLEEVQRVREAEEARAREAEEAKRVALNQKSNAEYSNTADERMAYYEAKKEAAKQVEAQKPMPVVEVRKEELQTVPQPQTTQPTQVVVASLRPTIQGYGAEKYYPPEHGHSSAGMDIVNAAFFSSGRIPVNGVNAEGKAPRPLDYDYADMIVEVKAAKESNNLPAEEKSVSAYLDKLDNVYGFKGIQRFPDEKILGHVESKYSEELSNYGRKPAEHLEEIKKQIADSKDPISAALAGNIAATEQQETKPELETVATTPSAPETDEIAEALAANIASTEQLEPTKANPEQLAAIGNSVKSLAGKAFGLAEDKLSATFQQAKSVLETTQRVAGALEANRQMEADAANLAKQQAAEQVAPAPTTESSVASTNFTSPLPTENLVPLSPEAQPLAQTSEVTKPNDPSLDDDGKPIPKATIVTEEELADDGVLPPRNDIAATKIEPAKNATKGVTAGKEQPPATKITIQSSELAKQLSKLLDGKDSNDMSVIRYLQGKGVEIDLPKGRPLIVTSSASAELGQTYIKLHGKDVSEEEFVTLTGKILEKGIVVDTAGKDDIKPDASLNPTQIRTELAALAKNQEIEKN